MKLAIKCFFGASILYLPSLNAIEISQIRFGKTEHQSRLVIESDAPITYKKLWSKGTLQLVVTGLDKAPQNDLITASALSVISRMNWQDDQLQIQLPVSKEQLDKILQLPLNQERQARLVIDWMSSNSLQSLSKNNSSSQPIEIVEKNVRAEALVQDSDNLSIVQSITTMQINAKNALTDKNYRLAISILNKILKNGNNEHKAYATEYLGVARERNRQYAFAKQHYQEFLNRYPKHQAANRVKQRLSSLLGIQELENTKTLKQSKRGNKKNKSNTRGSIATDYRQSQLVNDLGDRRQTLSLLGVDLDARGDYQLESGSLKYRFSAGHYEDLSDEGDDSLERLRYANLSWESQDESYRIDLGRQRSRGKGIFGRFDGILLGYNFAPEQRLNFVVGSPVASSKVLSLDSERSFVGISYDWQDIFDNVDLSLFALNQTIGDLTDRQAVGGDIRYVEQGISIYGLFDYDTFHSDLNTISLSGSYLTLDKTRYHWSYNQRKSPYISTRNALIGQPADSLEELQNLFLTDEEILDLAADRTLESKTSSLQISKPINKTFDISGNLTWTSLSGAPASGGVAEILEPGGQLYFNLYLGAARLYSPADSNQFGIRISQLSQSDVYSIYTSTQYRWDRSWSASMKLRFDDRENHNGGGQQSLSPSFRFQYQNKQQLIYSDFGAIFYTNQVEGLSDLSTDIYYLYMGYRYFF